jgi:S-formylglutathione hydrolase FrmB
MSAQASNLSLMGGWLPFAVQSVTIVALVFATGWRTRCWRVAYVPSSIAIGAIAMVGASLMLENAGIAGEPAPKQLWVWTTITGFGAGILVLGWRTSRWARRNAAVFAVSFSLLSTGLVINGWIGYFPTVGVAWNQLANRPLPGQTSLAAVNGMRARGERPSTGRLVAIETGSAASGFHHRTEWAYLPPAWFSSSAGPMPAVMMIGGEFNTPADWIRAGEAVSTADSFAGSHGGRAPVLVFVDPSGNFTADTECVNGVRGNAADHLTEDVVPQVISMLRVSADEARWAVAGFSSGGTCAVPQRPSSVMVRTRGCPDSLSCPRERPQGPAATLPRRTGYAGSARREESLALSGRCRDDTTGLSPAQRSRRLSRGWPTG